MIAPFGVNQQSDHFRFRYIGGAERARKSARFEAMVDFPDLHGDYESSKLFALFQNRVLTPGRGDFHEYVKMLDLPDNAEPVEILEVGGGRRATDSFEVFPKIEKGPDGAFRCRFFLHGWRHVNSAAQKRLNSLEAGEKLYVSIELTNPATQFAVQIQTLDYHMIGWAPRYLVTDLVAAIAQKIGHYEANVVRVNPMPARELTGLPIVLRPFQPSLPIETMLIRPSGRPPSNLIARFINFLKAERDALIPLFRSSRPLR
jgi:hypothetical protein